MDFLPNFFRSQGNDPDDDEDGPMPPGAFWPVSPERRRISSVNAEHASLKDRDSSWQANADSSSHNSDQQEDDYSQLRIDDQFHDPPTLISEQMVTSGGDFTAVVKDSEEDDHISISESATDNMVDSPTTPTQSKPMTGDHSVTKEPENSHDSFFPAPSIDLASSIRGFYRILELISEEGSGGLVDKIIIAQDSLRDFVNAMCPGAYLSLTRVDFKALDRLALKPVGVYGSKEEIVRFLSSIGAVDDTTAQKLLASTDDSVGPTLRSGLYIARPSHDAVNTPDEVLYVVYWPEHTTWNDDAAFSIQRNRVTFMRYLTKITDQVIALISSGHAKAIVWDDDRENISVDTEDEESGRMFTYEVTKTKEQEENVMTRPGFDINCPLLEVTIPPAECSVDPELLQPRLATGEVCQAFMTTKYIPAIEKSQEISGTSFNRIQVHSLLTNTRLEIPNDIGEVAIAALVKNGLQVLFPPECNAWKERNHALVDARMIHVQRESEQMLEKLKAESAQLKTSLHHMMANRVIASFPSVTREELGCPPLQSGSSSDEAARLFSCTMELHPKVATFFQERMAISKLVTLPDSFKRQKLRILTAYTVLSNQTDLREEHRRQLIILIVDKKDFAKARSFLADCTKDVEPKAALPITGESIKGAMQKMLGVVSVFRGTNEKSPENSLFGQAATLAEKTHDSDFLMQLPHIVTHIPVLESAATEARRTAHNHLEDTVQKLLKQVAVRVNTILEDAYQTSIKRAASSKEEDARRDSRIDLIREVEKSSQSNTSSQTLVLNSFEVQKPSYSNRNEECYAIAARRVSFLPAALEHTLHVLDLTADHRQCLQLQAHFIPVPVVEKRLSHSFQLPTESKILHSQLLENNQLLLVIDDNRNLMIFLERPSSMGAAIQLRRMKKSLHHDKLGHDFILTFDETKRMLAVCASTKFLLHIFVFDEAFTTLQTSQIENLAKWYPDGKVTITHVCFVTSTEEILLVDTDMQARVYSLESQTFRPASLQLDQAPTAVHSAPDGSCLFLSHPYDSGLSLYAYHLTNFGSTKGIRLDIPNVPVGNWALSAFLKRTNVHVIGLDPIGLRCRSVALDITRKATEVMFQPKGSRKLFGTNAKNTLHNCLIDCHADVWTLFPVVPAVRRQTIVSAYERHSRKLVFITDHDHDKYTTHFADLVQTFDKRTRKPRGDELDNFVVVHTTTFDIMNADIVALFKRNVSRLRAGEWLVDLLCLIPIHIAITRENRFMPLKDGVSSADLEKTLLGAEVGSIVDALSFGWYESLFQSYMVSKPVKVVSSMGTQSVGKSFMLNHLVDTSFAGSAMRTTEGVWMSVTPTQESLIVALDFEGVQSIERSVQEDTLLVLFNTAISNLVLFRNNFAISRDISDLFTSFQSSSAVLDPAANPTLFQSKLVIIIRDVIDSDTEGIVKECGIQPFITDRDEQEANFLSRLHGGNLSIVPWPVIESRQFYALFSSLKRSLDQQPVTHPAAGEFLHTLKTLMAKLKANDWSALSQTLVAHRAQRLLSLLPNALTYGYSEGEPDIEHLKNYDTDAPIEMPDTPSEFFLSGLEMKSIGRESALASLRKAWERDNPRQVLADSEWTSRLSCHLNDLADKRSDHVGEWISSNLERFKTSHATVEELRRAFDNSKVDLKTNVQLCKTECAECHLLCLYSRSHEGSHNCQTSHACVHSCDFVDDHLKALNVCGHPAGHSGRHICDVAIHLCGERCCLIDKPGCLRHCTKVAGHSDGDHMCSSSLHACGQACDLVSIKLSDGSVYSCSGTCSIPSHEIHLQHICDDRMCPVTCQLCMRLCACQDHLHGLDVGAVHLCGQGHPCGALCSADGICQIDTKPQSIVATFTGRHETFQYTKYTQVAKRLQCIVTIAAGTTKHSGHHTHTNDPSPFHYCETQCDSCGYYCTLPRGHQQQQHDTSHGSMSRTRWSVDGPDGNHLELEGRKFAANDEGAPMNCNLICRSMGRHVHIDYCRAKSGVPCDGPELEHISTRLAPDPDRPKDWITHGLYWRRAGFKGKYPESGSLECISSQPVPSDPYSRDEKLDFAKCEAACAGPEHVAPALPSFCTLPVFHDPPASNAISVDDRGYVSNDGHSFSCTNPALLQHAFHIVFVIDRSSSMAFDDRKPLPNTPSTQRIVGLCNNRLGAVYSSLFAFWTSRHAAVTAGTSRQDAYSVILFDSKAKTVVTNDFDRSADDLLVAVLAYGAGGGTKFDAAVVAAKDVMIQNWSMERSPVVIFLSDGESNVRDEIVQDLCHSALGLGKALSFHAVSFGEDTQSRSLRRMADIATHIQTNAQSDLRSGTVASSFSEALDTIRLTETFLTIAESLKKTRGALLR